VVSTFCLSACGTIETPLAPTGVAAPLTIDASTAGWSSSAERCANVAADGTATLGVVTLPDGTTGFGALWFPITLGGISGEMASAIVSQQTVGSDDQGAVHLTLEHAFRVPSGDYLLTQDRAVCAPAGADPLTCRVNDVLTISSGTGIFSNASGSLRNHGVIDFGRGSLEFSLRGRICGERL
jgi:hypothetical protein